MNVLIQDGNRHMRATGYGQLSRSIALALQNYSEHKIFFQKRCATWDSGIPHKKELLRIPEKNNLYGIDIIFRIGTPSKITKQNIPTVIYTQNALGNIIPEWVDFLKEADSIVVPGEFDAKVFRKYFNSVFICPQHVDNTVFKPTPSYRQEGSENTSFLFVGSYGYRKGVDLLFPVFKDSFLSTEKINLTIHCFSGLQNQGIEHLIKNVRTLPSNISISVFNGSLSPAWMNRIYNRHDVIISLSRGEGWCMPLHEALLCSKPVICPNSTSMEEYLPDIGVKKINVNKININSINDNFGESIKKKYGEIDNNFWDIDHSSAIKNMKDIYANYPIYEKEAKIARDYIINEFSLEKMAKKLSSVIYFTVENQ